MRKILAAALLSAISASLLFAAPTQAQTSIKIMVGGIDKQIYLPAKLAAQLGFFKEQGLDVELFNSTSGSQAATALLAREVQGVVGFYDHTIDLQSKGKFITSVVQFAVAPGEVVLVKAADADKLKDPANWKGQALGVTGLGSATDFLTRALAAKAGLKPQDYTLVPVGAGDTFLAGDAAGQDRLRHDHRADGGARGEGRHGESRNRSAHARGDTCRARRRLSRRLSLHGPRLDGSQQGDRAEGGQRDGQDAEVDEHAFAGGNRGADAEGMGAAGLTSSSVEMASKGEAGIELDLDAVPARETGMTPYEFMLSESQERMLMTLKPGREAQAKAIFEKWGLDAAVIGRTTDTGRLGLKWHGEIVCDCRSVRWPTKRRNIERPYTSYGEGLGINASGQVTGYIRNKSCKQIAFLWGDGREWDLNGLVDPSDPLKGRVSLMRGVDINVRGQIAANGFDSRTSKSHAYLVTPLEYEIVYTGPPAGSGWMRGTTVPIKNCARHRQGAPYR